MTKEAKQLRTCLFEQREMMSRGRKKKKSGQEGRIFCFVNVEGRRKKVRGLFYI